MSLASYYEDITDARGESKSYKSRKPKVQIGKNHLKKQDVSVAKTRYVPENDISFESILNSVKPSQPTLKNDIDASGESKQPKTLRPKPSLKTQQRSRQREPRRKQYVPVAKTRYIPPDEIQQRIQQTKPIKIQRVTSDEIQRRIQREIIRQEKEMRVYV